MSAGYRSPLDTSPSGGLEDPTVDLNDVRPPNSVSVQLARAAADAGAARVSRRMRAMLSLVGAGVMAVAVTWHGAAEAPPVDLPVQSASLVAPLAAPAVAAQVAVPATPVSSPAAPEQIAAVARPVSRAAQPGYGSRARRDCMAQVESAVLFQLMAKGAASRGAYNVAVNREIKRLAARHAVREPRMFDLIAAEIWAAKSQLSASRTWWTMQYQRCERSSLQGAQYLVSAR